MFQNIPILSIICYVPLLGALFVIFAMKGDTPQRAAGIRKFATAVAGVDFLLSLPLWFAFKRGGELFQFKESHPWIQSIGARYVFGIDGISFLLDPADHAAGLDRHPLLVDRHRDPGEGILHLVPAPLQTGMLGVFMALDFFLFFVFWEAMLVPMYLLIGIWGGPRKLYAAIKFFLYTLAGSVLMLLGILFLYFHHSPASLGFTALRPCADFYETAPKIYEIGHMIRPASQFWLFLAFFVGFAIKVPMFPSTPGCPTRTSRRRPPARSSSPAFC